MEDHHTRGETDMIIVVDTETTGMDPKTDRLVELAAIAFRLDEAGTAFTSLCNPGMPIPPEAKAVHHITEADVAEFRSPPAILSEMLQVFDAYSPAQSGEGTVWVAHNAEFDRSMLAAVDPTMAERLWICTWRCSMHLWPDAPGHSNQVLRYWLGLDPDVPPGLAPHRALYDVAVTREILLRMLETHSVEELVALSTQPVLLTTCRFGKHRGALWRDVPRDYLQWIMRQPDMDADTRHTAAHWLRPQGQLL